MSDDLPSPRALRAARAEFARLLDRSGVREREWQAFFAANPFVFSRSLPVKIRPRHIRPLGRPGRSEPDFVFYSDSEEEPAPIGVIELKTADKKIATRVRSDTFILTRAAETGVSQSVGYANTLHEKLGNEGFALVVGGLPYMFVIMGMSFHLEELLLNEMAADKLNSRMPTNCQIVPYDALYEMYTDGVPLVVVGLEVDWERLAPGLMGPDAETRATATLYQLYLKMFTMLSDRERRALWMRDVEGRSVKNLAQEMGMLRSSASSLMSRSRRKIHRAMLRVMDGGFPQQAHVRPRRRGTQDS